MRRKPISHRILLGVIFAGLNLLCFMGALHGHRMVQRTRINYSHVPALGTRRSRIGAMASVDAAVEHVVVVHLSANQAISLSQAGLSLPPHGLSLPPHAALAPVRLMLPLPDDPIELLAQENVLALGSAPRAPGLGRAPPTA
ncbi:hypothetical protein [Edaphobacter sp. 12200R-103]|uniref:hypothetical protein n=1 Tax=Edaphobacter sp. 12200R-103 TaxID=2703788 RepID=UPI00138D91A5|nr:hypothetical protein [Edaphobacter sp. 12200R-103]QHS50742.1 hypothetical protein GWR55_02505 [Edaphobacter sp. 12200R-103]